MTTGKPRVGNWSSHIEAPVTSILWVGSSLMIAAQRVYEARAEKAMMRFSPTNFV
jgi:hypothetical protein